MGDNRKNQLREKGVKRAAIEDALLGLFLYGHSTIEFYNRDYGGDSYALALLLNQDCDLANYALMDGSVVDNSVVDLPREGKEFFYSIHALEEFVQRGLLSASYWFLDDFSPEDGPKNLFGKLGESPAYHTAWLARALFVEHQKQRSFEYDPEVLPPNSPPIRYELYKLRFELTPRGLDLALSQQKHKDEVRRFEEQKRLTEQSVETARQSKVIASWALGVAIVVGVGAIGRLGFDIYKTFFMCV